MSTSTTLNEQLDDAIVPPSNDLSSPAGQVAAQREAAIRSRQKAGKYFSIIGSLFILSNLIILPAMAWTISRLVEHPAAVAIEKFTGFIEDSKKDDKKASALTAVATMADRLNNLNSTASQLSSGLRDLRSSSGSAAADTRLANASTALATIAVKPANYDANTAFAQVFLLTAATAQSKAVGVTVSRGKSDVTERFLLVPKDNGIVDLSKVSTDVQSALRSAQANEENVRDRTLLIARLNKLVTDLTPSDGSPGLLAAVNEQCSLLEATGSALNDLAATGPAIAKDARAATDVLGSVSGFILPYAYAVLAIGAMLVSIGVTSLLKAVRMRDESYDDAIDQTKTLMYARLASAFKTHGIPPDALVERLGRVGESATKNEGGVSLPVARAIKEFASAFARDSRKPSS